jgi:hypothetical protein
MKRLVVRASRLLAVVAALSLAFEPVALAGTPAPLSQSLTGEAKAAYDSGKLLFEDGDSQGALSKFSYSYSLSHDPRLLWNMATCEKELRHYARASALIGQYLKEGGNRLTAEQRQSALETQNALSAFYVSLKLTGVPDGATVFLDGTEVGQAPLSEPLFVDLGPRLLRVEQPGFEPNETKLDVAGGGELEVKVTLTPLTVASVTAPRLSIVSSGANDILAIDGKVVGSRRWEGPLTAGEHTVRVTAAHKKAYEARVQLTPGSTRTLEVTLEDEKHAMPIWPWVAGGAALVAGAAVGGYFLLKPQDSGGGHPQGSLATVYLSLGRAR